MCTSINDDEQQLIKLCLRKPPQWHWHLSTSKSSSHIQFPTIQLFDEDNTTLLAETSEADFSAGSKLRKSASVSKAFSSAPPSMRSTLRRVKSPITAESEEKTQFTRDPNVDSSSSAAAAARRQPRLYSRSSSCRSRSSILKRIREFTELNRDSSDDSNDDDDVKEEEERSIKGDVRRKYSLRTCNVGTILVPRESSPPRASRRRRRGSYPDNVTAATFSNNSGSNNTNGSSYLPRIIDVQDISKIGVDAQKYLKDVKSPSPSSDERLASLHCTGDSLKSAITNSNSHYRERERTSDRKAVGEHERRRKLNHVSDDRRCVDDTISECARNEPIMGSNVSSAGGKGLSGRRTQSQSNIDNKSSAIGNGICCSTKYSKSKRKNSTLSQQDFDKKPFTNNNNNAEHFDGVSQIIAANPPHVVATKPKKVSQGKSKEKDKDKDKKKLHGSLPNHLDTDVDYEGSDDTNSSIYQYPSNQIYQPPHYDNAQLSAIRKFDEIYQQQHRYQAEQHHFVHLKQQNLSFRVANTYIRQNFLRSHETNSFRIPQVYGNRVKFDPVNKILAPSSPPPHHQHHQQQQQQQLHVIDQCYDQGYGSERSPEDEVLPPLPQITSAEQYNSMVISAMPQGLLLPSTNQLFDADYQQKIQQSAIQYDFITEDCTFSVEIVKGMGGLGLSVAGGSDSSDPYPGLIRIKRLFPHQAAWMTGLLQTGDILLEANGIILTGLTNNEALEVLRTMGNVVSLLVCRPHDENFRKLLATNAEVPALQPVPPLRSSFNFKHQQYMSQFELTPGEFEITLVKQQGSLGFTLQKEDEAFTGHYVRALVREPATTDGRIRAGDKIIAVNDIPIGNMTHEQAVIFLRQAPETVKLRLFRCEQEQHSVSGTLKRSKLRPEAMSLISDLAMKKSTQSSSDGASDNSSLQSSSMSSPRRLRKHLINSNNSSKQSAGESPTLGDSSFNISTCTSAGASQLATAYLVSESGGTSSGTHTPFSDSSADTMTIVSQRIKAYYDPHELPADDDDYADAATADDYADAATADDFYDSDELESLNHDDEGRAKRPESLNLQSGQTDSGSTPQAARKPMYRFSIATANAYELNNLDAVLDAPTNAYCAADETDGREHSFASLPCETLLLACKTESDLRNSPANDIDTCLYVTKPFGKHQPLYQSAQVQVQASGSGGGGEKTLLKWKGVTMGPPSPATTSELDDNDDDKCSIISTSEHAVPMSSLRVSIRNAQKDINLDEMGIDGRTYKIITIEMNRRWSCRMGIRLESQPAPFSSNDGSSGKSITVIKEICKDTLAEKDGRLRAGDRVLMINDEIVDARSTQEIIDMMRIIRGPLCITIARKGDS